MYNCNKIIFIFLVLSLANVAFSNIHELSIEYSEFLKKSSNKASIKTSRAEREKWIERFEKELSLSRRQDPSYFGGLTQLAGLYDADGVYNQSLELLKEVTGAKQAPAGIRLLAARKSIDISQKSFEGVDDTFACLNELAGLVNEFKANGTQYSEIYDRIVFVQDFTKANIIEKYARHQAELLKKSNQNIEAQNVLSQELLKSAQLLKDYVSKLNQNKEGFLAHEKYLEHMNFSQPATLYRIAKLSSEVAGYYNDSSFEKEQKVRNSALDALKTFFADYPNHPKFSQQASKLYLTEKLKATEIGTEYVAFVKDLVNKVSKGHAVINRLTTIIFSTRDYPGKFSSGVNLCDIVINLEKKWFPEEYTQHVNYHDALINKGFISLELGDMSSVGDVLKELKELKGIVAESEYLQENLHLMQKEYDTYFKEFLEIVDDVHTEVGNLKDSASVSKTCTTEKINLKSKIPEPEIKKDIATKTPVSKKEPFFFFGSVIMYLAAISILLVIVIGIIVIKRK